MKLVVPRAIGLNPNCLEARRENSIAARNGIAADRNAWANAKKEQIDTILPELPVRSAKPGNITMREHLQLMRTRLTNSPTTEAELEIARRSEHIQAIEEEASIKVEYGN